MPILEGPDDDKTVLVTVGGAESTAVRSFNLGGNGQKRQMQQGVVTEGIGFSAITTIRGYRTISRAASLVLAEMSSTDLQILKKRSATWAGMKVVRLKIPESVS